MKASKRVNRSLSLLLLGAIALTSCSATPSSYAPSQEQAAPTEPETAQDSAKSAAKPTVPKPQLIRKAALELEVKDSGPIVTKIRAIIAAAQGDLLSLEEQGQAGDSRSASLTIRVPQDKLDRTLDSLSALGTVRRRSVTAEDVSTQIIDSDARLRNLKKSETAVLALLDRSGNVADILKVSQELSNIRAQIEQLTAQVTALKTQVAYSTIAIQLTESIALAPTQRQVGDQLGSAWTSASHSVVGFSRGLVILAIWLLAYSPYTGALAGLIYLLRRRGQKSRPIAQSPTEPID